MIVSDCMTEQATPNRGTIVVGPETVQNRHSPASARRDWLSQTSAGGPKTGQAGKAQSVQTVVLVTTWWLRATRQPRQLVDALAGGSMVVESHALAVSAGVVINDAVR